MAISSSQSKYVDLQQHVAINTDKTNAVNSKVVTGKLPNLLEREKGRSDCIATPKMPTPASTSTSPFYLVRGESAAPDEDTSISNLQVKQDLEQVHQRFFGKKVKETLSSFLPHLPGVIDGPGSPDTSLRAVIDKPPIGGKELLPLAGHSLAGFRLHPGPIPDQFRINHQPPRKKHKHKKHKVHDHERTKEGGETPLDPLLDKKHKKQLKGKKHDEGGGGGETKKKKKKEKKKKKRHTPEPSPSVNETLSSRT